ncbi:deoxynucleoside triphosphate triphosphohydrolase SAMHD1-like [Larimichthys crocea]|uniref:deoxynucleoside triphosphate triphosphohydrolase SAMHD1-like n=1 Tax=Larimichthys crocea TaxID=215358 RepID=UPI000F6032DD|nr:deoxynucleoside triphosphate triphosphohydrolase SAMHD1-like [Larimichthys crocea]
MVITMDYGMRGQDPIDEINFYSKYDHTGARKRKACKVSRIRPTCFSEKLIRFYCKKTDDKSFKKDKENFEEWCRKKDFPEYSETQEEEEEEKKKKKKK